MGFLDIYETGFTSYNCAVLCSIPFLPKETREALYPIVACTSWGIMTSFHSSTFWVTDVFDKFAARYNLSRRNWNFGNFIVHIVPPIITTVWQPKSISNYHGIIASLMNYSWILLASKGTYILDRVYIKCPATTWYKMISVSLITELITPSVFNLSKRIVKYIRKE